MDAKHQQVASRPTPFVMPAGACAERSRSKRAFSFLPSTIVEGFFIYKRF